MTTIIIILTTITTVGESLKDKIWPITYTHESKLEVLGLSVHCLNRGKMSASLSQSHSSPLGSSGSLEHYYNFRTDRFPGRFGYGKWRNRHKTEGLRSYLRRVGGSRLTEVF